MASNLYSKVHSTPFVPSEAAEDQLYAILESIGDGFFACDAEWRFVYMNAQAEQLLGITCEEVNGRTLWEVFPPTIGTRLEAEYRRAAAGEQRSFDNFYQACQRWYQNRCFPRIGGGMVVCFQDITERKQKDASELQLRNMLSEAQQIAHMGSFEYIVDSGCTVWSEEEFRIYGLDPAGPSPEFNEMLSKCIHPEDRELLARSLAELLTNASIYELEHRIIRPDGSVRWVYNKAYPYFDANGKLVRYIGTTLDITERLALEEALRQKDNLLHTLTEKTSDVIYVKDIKGRYLLINKAGADFTGLPVHEILGHDDTLLFSAEEARKIMEMDCHVMAGANVQTFEEMLTNATGTIRILLATKGTIFNAEGQCVGLYGISRDITERKAMEEQIRRLNANLEQTVAERTAELRASEEKFRALVETTSDCIWETDNQGRFTYLSPRFKDITGHPAETFLGKTPNDLLPAADLDQAGALVPDSLADQQPVRLLEYPVWHSDGCKVIVEVNATPYFDNEGNLLGVRGVTRNITARKQLEKEREQYSLLCNTSADLMAIFDTATNHFTQVNPAFCELTGYSESELLVKPLVELVHPDDRDETLAATGDSSRHAYVRGFKNRYLCKDGTTVRWLSWQSFRDNKTGLVYATARDITEKQLAEEQLRNSEERFRLMFMQHSAIMLLIDPSEAVIVDANQAATEFYGYTRDQFTGLKTVELIALPIDEIRQLMQRALDRKENIFTVPHRLSDGSIRTVEVHTSPIESNGRTLLFPIVYDITDKKALERALILAKATIDTVSDEVHWLTPDARILDANPAMCRALGYSRDELLRMSILDIDPHFDSERFEKLCSEVRKGASTTFETEHRAKDGRLMPVEVSVSHVQVGTEERVCAIARDLTKRLKFEEELQIARDNAEESNQAKSRFLAMMSHEIRTPMNGLMGLIQLLLKTELTEKQRKFASDAISAGKELVQLLNSILDLSKIESNRLILEEHDFTLRQTIEETVSLMALTARQKGLRFSTAITDEVPDRLRGDSGRLRQILTNLISNAVKFTSKGKVAISIGLEAEDQQEAVLGIEVSDTGIGLPRETLNSIFEPFTQADSSTTRLYGGTGLGLSICKRLVELMGGSISVTSEEGIGSSFRFTVAMTKQQQPQIAQPSGGPSEAESVAHDAGRRILLAEDDLRAQEIVREMLEMCGYQVGVASDGKEVIQALEQETYDLVLMDCMMPEMDGCQTTRIIRDPASAVRQHDIPIIALTGNTMPDDVKLCLAAGMNDHLQKPLIFDDLLEKLRNIC